MHIYVSSRGTRTRLECLVNHDGKKLRDRSGKKVSQKSRNSCAVNDQSCGCKGTIDSRRKTIVLFRYLAISIWYMGWLRSVGSLKLYVSFTERRNFTQSWNQIQTLKECRCCHIYCAQLCAHSRAIATASCAVSKRQSRYPRGEDS